MGKQLKEKRKVSSSCNKSINIKKNINEKALIKISQ